MSLSRWYYIVRLRLRSIFRRDRAEEELAEEIQFHLEERERDLMAHGMAPADAHTVALRAFGGVEQRKEECRDARRVGWVDDLTKDIVYGLRVMRRSPGFTAVAALSLAIGIGANTSIFTVFDALVLRPLPVNRPAELRTAHSVIRIDGRSVKSNPALPYPVFRNLYSDRSVFSELLAFSPLEELVVGERTPGFQRPLRARAIGSADDWGRDRVSHGDRDRGGDAPGTACLPYRPGRRVTLRIAERRSLPGSLYAAE